MKSFPRNLISLRPRRNPSRNHWRKKLRLTSFLWLVSEVTTVLKSQGDLSHLCYCICPVWIYVRNIQLVRSDGGWWLVLVWYERKVLLASWGWLVYSERKALLSGGW
jgi:hypothetical protein